MIQDYKQLLSEKLSDRIRSYAAESGVDFHPAPDEIRADLTVPPDGNMGDYAFPCFRLAKAFKKPPPAIAADLAARLAPAVSDGRNNAAANNHAANNGADGQGDRKGLFNSQFSIPNSFAAAFSGVEAAAGYVNFKLNRKNFIGEVLSRVLTEGENYGRADVGKGKTVCIDYSSVNIAKPFHMGHLTNTALGGSLYKIYKALGYAVVGINHLGDYGTQFGNLIAAYKRWGGEKEVKERGIFALLDWYVKFHAEEESDPALKEEGRAWFKAIEEKRPDALAIFELFKRITLAEVAGVYADLNVAFDSWDGESFFTDKIPAVVDELRAKNLLAQSEGAWIVDLEDEKLPPALILRNDGSSLYITRDLAAAEYRAKTYRFDKCLYVVAYQQNLHFRQLFAVLKKMGKPWAGACEHVAHGMVSMADGAMSTRKGKVVFLKDVIGQACEKAREIIEAKNPDLPDKGAVAKQIGTGAVIYGALSTARIKDAVFDIDAALNFDGETGPYVMYTHARCRSVLAKGNSQWNGHFSLSQPVMESPSKENSPAKKEKSVENLSSGRLEKDTTELHNAQCTMHNAQLKDNAEHIMQNAECGMQNCGRDFGARNEEAKGNAQDSAQCTAHSPQLKDGVIHVERTDDKKNKSDTVDCGLWTVDCLDNPEAFALSKLLYKFPETVQSAARDCEPSYITRLVTDTAQAFNKFYFEHKILTEDPGERAARLKLTAAAGTVLKNGLELLLMSAPERM